MQLLMRRWWRWTLEITKSNSSSLLFWGAQAWQWLGAFSARENRYRHLCSSERFASWRLWRKISGWLRRLWSELKLMTRKIYVETALTSRLWRFGRKSIMVSPTFAFAHSLVDISLKAQWVTRLFYMLFRFWLFVWQIDPENFSVSAALRYFLARLIY